MCSCSICNKALAALSRRDILQLGAVAVATGSLTLLGANVQATEKPQRAGISSIPANNIADLTHVLSPEFPYIPIPGLTFPFKLTAVATLEKHGVYANKWELIEHNGTHIDAPSHFIAGQMDIEAVPVDNLIVPIAVIDIEERASIDSDTAVTPDDVLRWEARNGRLPAGAAVFMRSGWGKKVRGKSFLGIDGSNTMHFPGFSEETCNFLVSERNISGVGVDTISFDIGPDHEYTAHKALFRGGKWGIECLAKLETIPEAGAIAVVGAPLVKGASGGPCRVFAFW